MNAPVWLIDVRGQAELPEGTFGLDGVTVRSADRRVLGIGVKTGFFSKRTLWGSPDDLLRADGDRAWLAVSSSDLTDRPPEGVWLHAELPVRHGTETIGTVGWVGISDGVLIELGIVPADPRVLPRRIQAEAIQGLNDRSVVVNTPVLEDEPLLKTDREIEEEVRRRLWETTGSLPYEALERITVAVRGGVVVLGGMVPKDEQRALAVTIAQEPLEVRGVDNRIETAESIAASAQRLSTR